MGYQGEAEREVKECNSSRRRSLTRSEVSIDLCFDDYFVQTLHCSKREDSSCEGGDLNSRQFGCWN